MRLLEGQPQLDSVYALNDTERALGWILACSARTRAGDRVVLDV